MEKINENSRASIEFCVKWVSSEAQHRDFFYTENVNFWRDCFTPDLFAKFKDRQAGETVVLHDQPDIPAGRHRPEKMHKVLLKQFDRCYLSDWEINPQRGRFYPLGMVQGLPGVFRDTINLCRCTKVNGHDLELDLNHPLAGYPLTITAAIQSIRNNSTERGGRCEDWLEAVIQNGPGMQARYPGITTDFAYAQAFHRADESADHEFYKQSRLVHHIDSRARKIITSIYQQYLQPESAILDLMGSWTSHLPEVLHHRKLTVLGMNQEELEANRPATERVIHDLNAKPDLPFPDHSFDAVICTVSVEYMSRPYQTFKEIGRILKQGGLCIMTFSNRWFPPKVVRIWEELHEFEKVGLVCDYFLQTEMFKELETITYRGWPRPEDDTYYAIYPYADPAYIVIARKNSLPF
jgi:SAM-dependent methyltransferase